MSSGTRGARRAPGGSLLFRDSGTDGKFGRLPEEGFSLGTRKHVACSEGRSGRSLGAASKGLRGSFRLALRDTWHVPKERPKGLFRRRVEKGFRGDDLRAGFRDRWHFPEDGPAGVSAEASKGGIWQGFEKGEGSFGDTRQTPEGLRKGLSIGFRRGFRNDYHRWIRDQRLGYLC